MIKNQYFSAIFAYVSFAMALMLILALIPTVELEVMLLLYPTIVLSLGIIAWQTLQGKIFSILSFWSFIFLLEAVGGSIKFGIHLDDFDIDSIRLAMVVGAYLASYVVFLFGYYIGRITGFIWISNLRSRSYSYERKYVLRWNMLFALLFASVCLQLVQTYQRILAAGGLFSYLSSMYLYRFGTMTEGAGENAIVVLSNLLGGLGLTFAGAGMIFLLLNQANKFQKYLLYFFWFLMFSLAFLSGFRSVAFYVFIAFIGTYVSMRPADFSKIGVMIIFLIILLSGINFLHQYMYFLTADWDFQEFAESLGNTSRSSESLYGKNLLEAIFFFIPRFIWESKASEYGTTIVQIWAGLPDNYQVATTAYGEMIAHFGYIGLFGIIPIGMVHGWFEFMRSGNPIWRSAYYCLILPRILVHAGMGIGALSITLYQIALLYVLSAYLVTTHVRKSR